MILNQKKINDVKIFVPLACNCTENTCTKLMCALIFVLIRDGFGACFVVPEVVQTILHFGNTVAVLILAKNVLLLFVRKFTKLPQHIFLTSPHSLFHIFLMAESICL